MNPTEKQRITLNIDNRSYTMYVQDEKEEEIMRKAERVINSKVMAYKKMLRGEKDLASLAYATIDLVRGFLTNETKANDAELLDEISAISNDIDEYIRKN